MPNSKRKIAGRPARQAVVSSLPGRSTISSKGQIVIPAALRRKYHLDEGVTVSFREENGHIVLEPDRFAALLALRGTLPFDAEAVLIEEKRKECEREDRER